MRRGVLAPSCAALRPPGPAGGVQRLWGRPPPAAAASQRPGGHAPAMQVPGSGSSGAGAPAAGPAAMGQPAWRPELSCSPVRRHRRPPLEPRACGMPGPPPAPCLPPAGPCVPRRPGPSRRSPACPSAPCRSCRRSHPRSLLPPSRFLPRSPFTAKQSWGGHPGSACSRVAPTAMAAAGSCLQELGAAPRRRSRSAGSPVDPAERVLAVHLACRAPRCRRLRTTATTARPSRSRGARSRRSGWMRS